MRVDDPTSVALSLPSRLGQSWTVREIEKLQVQAAADSRDGAEMAAGDDAAGADRLVSGRYRSAGGDTELELRIDIDGVRPTRCISGDFFRRTGGTTAYTGSFILKSPNLSVTAGSVVATGRGVFSFQSSSPRIKVTIAPAGPTQPHPAAAVQFLTDGEILGASACGDARDNLIAEYSTHGVAFRPVCASFVSSGSAGPYSFGTSRESNTWNTSNAYNWAMLLPKISNGLTCITDGISPPTINSGYRNPARNDTLGGR